ncbi:MAG TPA: hypothetical protein VFA20_33145 [Myxococcaceae bacterium]|nr:hypothetical protein [Myxococcaceae bacterium]
MHQNITWALYILGDGFVFGDDVFTALMGQFVGEQDGKLVTVSPVGAVDSDLHLQHHLESLKAKGFDVTLDALKKAELRLGASLAGLPGAQNLLHNAQRLFP